MVDTSWFWAHRRNTSLHHMSLFVRGLHNNGFFPIVNFSFTNQLYVGKPSKGCYIFYSKKELQSCYKKIQTSLEKNKQFPKQFTEKSKQNFERIFAICESMKQDLKKLTNAQLQNSLVQFRNALSVSPIITVQLYGIEACWDEQYHLHQEIQKKVRKEKINETKGILSQSAGKTVAYSERESFLQILKTIQSHEKACAKFKQSKDEAIKEHPFIYELIQEHINEFHWVNSEYVSEKRSSAEWINAFQKQIHQDADQELQQLKNTYQSAIQEKKEKIEELQLSDKARHTINCLDAFVADRDWAKGKFCYALASYEPLLEEIAIRLNQTKEDILNYDINELITAIRTNTAKNVEKRKQTYILASIDADIHILESNQADEFLEKHGLNHVFSKVPQENQLKGFPACKGIAQGLVRVVEQAKDIESVQEGEILVTYMTTMEFAPVFSKVAGIITDEGGLSSHAAIISREFNIPCITGTQIATRALKTGDKVRMDGSTGQITRSD